MQTSFYSRFLFALILFLAAMQSVAARPPLRVVIIRHAEKPDKGKNLSCQGQNRAAALPAVLYQKFGKPDYTYVPAVSNGKKTGHLRMFQTITPFATQYNLKVNSNYSVDAYGALAADILQRSGTVLVVWEHSAINNIAKALGVKHPGKWAGNDFDSIWIISYDKGNATLQQDQEGLHPSPNCK